MSASTLAKSGNYKSGFCGYSRQHDRCPGSVGTAHCTCLCHTKPEQIYQAPPEPTVTAAPSRPRLPAAVLDMLSADAARPRSSSGFGPSGFHGCARETYHQLRADPACNDTDPWQAIVGTAIHESYTIARRANAIAGRDNVPLVMGELVGTADWVDDFEDLVEDLKTKGDKSDIAAVRTYGPDESNLAQINWYAMAAGKPKWRLVYVPRDGKAADSYQVEGVTDPAVVERALAWLEEIKAAVAAEIPPEPEKDAATWCATYCPFYAGLCPGKDGEKKYLDETTDPRVQQALVDYATFRAAEKAAKASKDAAGAVLGDERVRFGAFAVTHSTPKEKPEPDMEAIRAEYAAVGRPLPTRPAWTSSRMTVSAPRASDV